jgi:hypothetical protein
VTEFVRELDGRLILHTWQINPVTTSIEVGDEIPKGLKLCQNYPNPFNPATTFRFNLPRPSFVTLKIYNLLGKEVDTLVSEQKQAGEYEIVWNARGFSSGIYLYQMQVGHFIETRKFMLQK